MRVAFVGMFELHKPDLYEGLCLSSLRGTASNLMGISQVD